MPRTNRSAIARLALILLVLGFGVVHNFRSVGAEVGGARTVFARAEVTAAIAAGDNHTCAILSDGSLWCWGRNNNGQLGIGSTTNASTPTRVGSASNWRSVSAGGSTTCAVSTGDEAYCWGYNFSGQVGISSSTSQVTSPAKVTALGADVGSVAVGGSTACAVMASSGAVKCWGNNAYGQLGNGSTTTTHAVQTVSGLAGPATAVVIGSDGACALLVAGTAQCWGNDLWGQRGNDAGVTTNTNPPTYVSGSSAFAWHQAIASGPITNCAIITNSSLRCWGRNDYGTFGTTVGNTYLPVQPPTSPISDANVIAVGYDFMCVVKSTNGSIICSGADARGQVSRSPTGTGYLAVVSGYSHSCAVSADQHLVCWGQNPYGELGNGNTTSHPNYADGPSTISFGAVSTVGSTLPPDPPSAPRTVTAWPGTEQVVVTWTAPADPGAAAISSYAYRIDSGSGFGAWTSTGSTDTSVRITGLSNGVAHRVEVRATSTEGDGPAGPDSADAVAVALATATPQAPCDPFVDCVVGSVGPGGGVVFHDAGSNEAWGRFIEAAPAWWSGSATDPTAQWGCSGTNITGTSTAIGASASSTDAVSSRCSSSAARTVANLSLTVGGSTIDDWLLPTRDEVVKMQDLDHIVSGFDPAGGFLYWSSSQASSTNAYPGSSSTSSKSGSKKIRPVRYMLGPAAPSAPRNVTARAGEGSVTVDWSAPTSSGTATVTDIEYRISTDGGAAFGPWTSSGTTSGSTTITGLTVGTAHLVQLRAVSAHGESSAAPSTTSASAVAAATATPSTICDPIIDCDLGDIGPGGGVIVHDSGGNEAWGRYIEAAPPGWSGSGLDTLSTWGCSGSDVAAARDATLGAGAANTAAIVAACGSSAAGLADGLSITVGGVAVDDWHLPSTDELALVVSESSRLGGWRSGAYWTSTEIDASTARGSASDLAKTSSAAVRPIRLVGGPATLSAPVLVNAAATDGSITVSWNPPSSSGTAPIDDYEVRVSDDDGQSWGAWTSLGIVTSHTVSSLVNGSAHRLEVRAVNRGGAGAALDSGSLTPSAPPSAPGSVTATAVAYGLRLEWSAPSSTGGLPLLGYEIRLSTDGGSNWGSWEAVAVSTSHTLTGLDPALSYVAEVRGVNADGAGPAVMSALNGVTPATTTTTTTTPTTSAPTTTTTVTSTTAVPTSSSASSTTGPQSPGSSSVATGTTLPGTGTTGVTGGPVVLEPPMSTAPPVDSRAPTAPGRGRVIVSGEMIEVEILRVPSEIADRAPDQRSADDIDTIRRVGDEMIAAIVAASPDRTSPVSIRYTESGAVVVGLVVDPTDGSIIEVPVEEVSLLIGGGLVLMVGGLAADGSTDVLLDGVIRLGVGGWIAVVAVGMTPNTAGSVVVMSEPRLLGSFVLDSSGNTSVQVRIPGDLPVGAHTAVVSVAADTASIGFEVIPAQRLPTTGLETERVAWGVLVTALGGLSVLLGIGRRRRPEATLPV